MSSGGIPIPFSYVIASWYNSQHCVHLVTGSTSVTVAYVLDCETANAGIDKKEEEKKVKTCVDKDVLLRLKF